VVFLKNVIHKSLASVPVFWWHWSRASGPNSLLAGVGVAPPALMLVPMAEAAVGVRAGKQAQAAKQSPSTWHSGWWQQSCSSASEACRMLNNTTLLFKRRFPDLVQPSHATGQPHRYPALGHLTPIPCPRSFN